MYYAQLYVACLQIQESSCSVSIAALYSLFFTFALFASALFCRLSVYLSVCLVGP